MCSQNAQACKEETSGLTAQGPELTQRKSAALFSGSWAAQRILAMRLPNPQDIREDREMPLVRIALMKGKPEGFGKKVGEIVYRAMVDAIHVPPRDHFQII